MEYTIESYTNTGSSGVTTALGNSYWYYPADFPYDDTSAPWTKGQITYHSSFNDHQFPHNNDLEEIKKELKKLKKKLQKKEIPMKNLFNVIVVSNEEKILLDTKVVATDREEAGFNAGIHSVIVGADLKPKDVSILINDLGQVRVKPETKTVKIVKE